MGEKICAIVVTYNRKELLDKCLNALLNQSTKVDNIVVIDNASTDGTQDLLEQKYQGLVTNHKMETNTGGAGGFYEGIKTALSGEYDWVWAMDDDTIPHDNCLEMLMKAKEKIIRFDRNPAFFASAIYGENNECMNVPLIDECIEENGYPAWYRFLGESIITIKCATFVSVLFNRHAIEKCGLPYRDFFIWGDDSEYTFRMQKYYGRGYFVGNSIAIHLRKNATSLAKGAKDETDPVKIKRLRYYYRNMSMIGHCYYKSRKQTTNDIKLLLSGVKNLTSKNGLLRFSTIVSGLFESITGRNKLRRYINEQVKSKGSDSV